MGNQRSSGKLRGPHNKPWGAIRSGGNLLGIKGTRGNYGELVSDICGSRQLGKGLLHAPPSPLQDWG